MSQHQGMASGSGSGSGSDIEKGQVDGSVSVTVDGGRTIEQLKSALNTKVWKADSPLPFTCCIFKVPDVLRRQKEQAYEPDIVSIGPLHRRADKKFELVENVKEWYLKCLLLRKKDEMTLDSLIDSIKELEKEARGCYSDPCKHLDQNDFIEMLILDGCFLIELFRKASDERRQDNDDPIFNAPCMLEYLYHDLMCLENQLPWSVLEFFYKEIERGNDPDTQSLRKLVIKFFRDSVADPDIFSNPGRFPDPTLHILDLIRSSLVHGYIEPSPAAKGVESTICCFKKKGAESTKPEPTNHLPQRIPSAATLSEAGVKFRKLKQGTERSGCILNITFEKGKFTIPPLAIDERTDPLFRNLMAYEQCYHSCEHLITSYAVLMDNLIDTDKDVDFLGEKGIVANWLSADDASKFFNDLYNDTTVIDFVYKELCKEVNDYHKIPWNKWKEALRRDYFNTPWSIISFVAAFVLLVLTVMQTIFTIVPP